MIVFPNCKINLGLHITGKRSDGYHHLETVFVPVKWYDVLEIISSEKKEKIFSASGIIASENDSDNICLKAYSVLKNDFPEWIPPVGIYLHKTIPAGAGLGGGSADAAFTLRLLNQQFNLGLSPEQLISYAERLGSDCPFFIINQPCFATGRGEKLEPIHLDLSLYKFLLVSPPIHINTKEAFTKLVPTIPVKSIKEIIQQPVITWKEELKNDFEESVFEKHPAIENIKKNLYEAGAVYASMSGSGSTVYGLFNKAETISINFPSQYSTKESAGQLN
ncbi:MAG: 4-(cytidine 5-diphospho)-2-C-methyl-D-erythritol kinase [Chitinophagaceae bacterium]|nr:4-(cytidine 5-diphospho)-2-C-methyl-D-erythritol kinase [Chitinophagaceae bacterium]